MFQVAATEVVLTLCEMWHAWTLQYVQEESQNNKNKRCKTFFFLLAVLRKAWFLFAKLTPNQSYFLKVSLLIYIYSLFHRDEKGFSALCIELLKPPKLECREP